MQPVALASIALVATAATLFASADAHGQMLVPDYRQISAKFRKDSGALSQAGDQELQYAPVENLSGRSQKDFPEAATFNLMNGCRGTVYEEGNNVTTLQPGKDFDVKWIIQAPHPGTMKLSIVKPSEDSAGKITYKNYKTILTVDPFAQNGGGEDGTTTTMPTDVTGCDSAGDCALEETMKESDEGSNAQNSSPSTNNTPTATTAAPEATTAPSSAATTPSTSTSESSVAGDADSNKCSRRMRRH
ncbi:hypothetical protein PHYSODRAFT_318649 [Phytophthora sojae]|uniref:Chitin-binding type-4 domain-containing protein n=1 Tax=Phytophthora sojae (strain P6497) TaxID=1094619 RepID=G5A5S8_PHYSP|nr:hypothetical protein PHYSODRAFT_318649 [Phytophthora sojae]EGZ08683.1 hypothetical protein PHYSODRAFT_318649 [Phytophthora sojae]|eukprot:XP_009535316.1 hypothetical protein PHYSODRAFT_318649 [Phytophthora sojae]